MNYRMVGYVLGMLLMFEGIFMAAPILTAAIYGESELSVFIGVALFCIGIGILTSKLCRPKTKTMFAREGYLIVAFSWILLSICGALPFVISGAIPSFIDALFESVSGFTTTGATILGDVESLPKSILMWRSFTHWFGGMGVLVFIMAFIPLSGGQNMYIMKAESPGPSVGKLVPRIKTTALILYSMYLALTVLEFILLAAGDMNIFEAINTAVATAGTGGFGVKNNSIGGFSSYTQIVVTVFMFLFSVNFTSFYLLLRGKFKEALNSEIKVFFGLSILASVIIFLNTRSLYSGNAEALKHSVFTVGTIMSTTGFSTVDFNAWPEVSRSVILLLMLIGACAGSTCGGFKISRIIILFQSMIKELQILIHPRQVKKIKVDGRQVEHEIVRSVHVFLICYVLILIISTFLLSFDGHDLITNFTAASTTLNNVGPGLEMVGPISNFSVFSTSSKIVLIFDMLVGRLEIFPILLLFTPSTWKK
ncbi:MAG: TrkH family potassium uptake protein [Oscillospiraceae bacterium]|nr:TrkH family potassium uptake protein [Oscillospiraceae bacterium]